MSYIELISIVNVYSFLNEQSISVIINMYMYDMLLRIELFATDAWLFK